MNLVTRQIALDVLQTNLRSHSQ